MAVLCLYLLPVLAGSDEAATSDPWTPIRSFVGEWEGTSQGETGTGNVKRTYAFVLKDRYLHEKNVSTYPSQGSSHGEVHEHWSFFSYDRARKMLVLRQFHQEGFVNRYALNDQLSKPGILVFEREQFENFDNTWRAKETYEIASTDEFVEIFELAPPGKPFAVYSKNHFKRVKK
jgi:hypothetical protein